MKRTLLLISVCIIGAFLVTIIAIFRHVTNAYQSVIYTPDALNKQIKWETLGETTVAIVFGAGIINNTYPTDALADRIMTAVDLYKAGLVKKILMSGDNRFVNYNEPIVMKNYAVAQGVPEKDIVLDHAGRRTYDTCWRAKYIFSVNSAVLVTQKYHLNRALYLCNSLGIDSVGVAADRHKYSGYATWVFREWLARLNAWFDVLLKKPAEIEGEKIPISSTRQENMLY